MLKWLRTIDDAVFSPPHKFETVLGFGVSRLGLAFERESEERAKQETPSRQEGPKTSRR